MTVLYAKSINDVREQQQELTQKDIDDVLAWKKSIENKNGYLTRELASYLAPQIIGHEHVKKGLVMVAANAGRKGIGIEIDHIPFEKAKSNISISFSTEIDQSLS